MSLKPWWDVYPRGTKEGDEESRFFCAIARHPEQMWRSIDDLSKESNLSKLRIEEIITKYAPSNMLLVNSKEPDKWGYWERVGEKEMVIKTVLEEEQNSRINKTRP